MLTDAEIILLRQDKSYKSLTKLGLRYLVRDIVLAGDAELKPDVSTAIKIAYVLTKSRVVRDELIKSSNYLLERLLNHEQGWRRDPLSVRDICEAGRENYLWMRYDGPRVDALFSHSINLLMDAQFRSLIKAHSGILLDKNRELENLTNELISLRDVTVRSISTKQVFDTLVKLSADEFYRKNETEIQDSFLNASRGGMLGLLPEHETSNESDYGHE